MFWDERYSQSDYVYGKEPNDFLVAVSHQIPQGQVLCLAEGEGRNGVYLAQQGYQVTGVDASSIGLEKARKLSLERGVEIETVVADLSNYTIPANCWDGIISIFCHLPPPVRASIHRQVVSGLRSGGVFVLEAYAPPQLELKTGGPPTAELMMDAGTLKVELAGLEFLHLAELEREIYEGKFHQGRSAVVQVVAIKP